MNPYIYAAIFAIGFLSGYYLRDLQADSEKLVIEQANVNALQSAKERADKLEQELFDERNKRKKQVKWLSRKLNTSMSEKQKTDSVCNLTNNTLRLLQRVSMSVPAKNLAPANTETSTIRETDVVSYLAQAMQQYNAARSQCNLLIKWHTQKK